MNTAKRQIEIQKIKRIGNYILLAPGLTATEGFEGNMPTLMIREKGKQISFYRGSSLGFCRQLTSEDRQYLASLATV